MARMVMMMGMDLRKRFALGAGISGWRDATPVARACLACASRREPLCWPLQRKTAGRGAGAAPTTAFLPCYAAPVPPRGRGYCASSKGRLWTRGSAIKCALCGQELWEGAVLSGRETCETEAYRPAETYPYPSIRLVTTS